MVRKHTRQERFLGWLIDRISARLDTVSDREWARHEATAVARIARYVYASRH